MGLRGVGPSGLRLGVGAVAMRRRFGRSGGLRPRRRRLGWWLLGAVAAALGVWAVWYLGRTGVIGSGVVWVHNALAEPVEILRDGSPFDTVAPEASVRLMLARGTRAVVRWRLLRPCLPAIGEPLEGALPPAPRVRGRRVAAIRAAVDRQSYFAPLITNTTPSDIPPAAHPGTGAARRCNCVVPKGAVRTH